MCQYSRTNNSFRRVRRLCRTESINCCFAFKRSHLNIYSLKKVMMQLYESTYDFYSQRRDFKPK